jgi:hypothetical protein
MVLSFKKTLQSQWTRGNSVLIVAGEARGEGVPPPLLQRGAGLRHCAHQVRKMYTVLAGDEDFQFQRVSQSILHDR